jgi:hypothetical protein
MFRASNLTSSESESEGSPRTGLMAFGHNIGASTVPVPARRSHQRVVRRRPPNAEVDATLLDEALRPVTGLTGSVGPTPLFASEQELDGRLMLNQSCVRCLQKEAVKRTSPRKGVVS